MKRYMLSILLAIFAFGGIGSYYVYGALTRPPDYRIEVTEGEERLFSGVLIAGHYERRWNSRYVEVATAGSKYMDERSLFKPQNRHPLERELERNAHGFLRGKSHTPVNFYADGRQIVYAETNTKPTGGQRHDVTAEVAMLDRQSGKRTAFRTVLETRDYAAWSYLADVQAIGDELHLFVEIDRGWKVYVLAPDGERLRTVDIPLEAGWQEAEDGTRRRASLAVNHRPHAPKGVVGLYVRTYGPGDDGGSGLKRIDLYVYDYAAEEVRLIGGMEVTDPAADDRPFHNQMTDRHHHLVWHDESNVDIHQISLADGTVRSFSRTAGDFGGTIVRAALHEGHAYVLTRDRDDRYAVTVLDLDSLSVAAKARIASADEPHGGPAGTPPSGQLSLYGFLLP